MIKYHVTYVSRGQNNLDEFRVQTEIFTAYPTFKKRKQ